MLQLTFAPIVRFKART